MENSYQSEQILIFLINSDKGITKYLIVSIVLLISVRSQSPEIKTCGSRIVSNTTNIKPQTMGMSSLKCLQEVEELLYRLKTEINVNRY